MRISAMTKMTPLLLRLEPEMIAEIDKARGDVPRAAWVRRAVQLRLHPTGAARAAPLEWPVKIKLSKDRSLVQSLGDAMAEASAQRGLDLPVGNIRKPMQKTGKK
jgi:hypothetical protein